MQTTENKEKNKFGWLSIAFMLFVTCFGTGVITLPFIASQLGLISFLILLFIDLLITTYTGCLLNESLAIVLENENEDFTRNPYPAIAEKAFGKVIQKIVNGTIIIANILTTVGMLLMSAEVCTSMIPINYINGYNQVRLWSFLLTLIMLPVMYYGSLKELRGTSVISFSAIVAVAFIIIIQSLLIESEFERNTKAIVDADVGTLFFSCIGVIIYATQAIGLVHPNLVMCARSPRTLYYSVVVYNIAVYISFSLIAVICYFVYGSSLKPSLMTTMAEDSMQGRGSVITVKIIQVLFLIHILPCIVMILNPVFQIAEKQLNISADNMMQCVYQNFIHRNVMQ